MLGHEHRSKCAKMAGGRNASVVVNVTLPVASLTVGIEALWHHHVKLMLRPCHRYVEETALFLNFGS